MKLKGKKIIIVYIIFAILAIITWIPFQIMIANAGRTQLEINSSVALLPSGNFQENLTAALELAPLFRGLFNSFIIATTSTLLSIYFSTMVAYGFRVYDFRYKNVLFSVLLCTMMIPTQFAFIGFYEMIKEMGLLNTYWPLILPGIANASCVFFLFQYCKQAIHMEIIESSRIDGASELKIFHRISIPILMPAMATMSIFSFIGSWNSYLVPLLILNDPEKFTLPLMINYINGLAQVEGMGTINTTGAVYASLFVSVIPVLIIFIFFAKRIVNGLSAGSVKG